jgi:penicillin-insensitive murein endopeptidase
LYIGHISAKEGGYLKPHLSHQSGRDVDISFYYVDGSAAWYARAHQKNLDVPRTWAFVKALIEETDVEMILIDHSIQRLIREHALQSGEDAAWVEQLFRGRGAERPLILHAPGHATHLHIRFYSPIAQETARRAYPHLVKHKRMTPPTSVIQHKVKKGETLGMLARKYRTTVQAIQRANGLKSTKIQAKKVYRIPRSGAAPYPVKNPLVIPARRRAPTRSAPATREQPQATRQ